MMHRRLFLVRRVATLVAMLGGGGCAASPASAARVPDPETTRAAYTAALREADVDTLYGLMTRESRRALSKAELRRMLEEQRVELTGHAEALDATDERILEAKAEIRFGDGERVTLDYDGAAGGFRVAAADALPAAARSPAQALGQLRKVLARRSYAGLLRVLAPRVRAAWEEELGGLVEGLVEPESLDIEIVGDKATVAVPGGHRVTLVRRDGVWHIAEFF
ncbi:MAG: hypothetical protein AAF928_13360 [Myxococcota bacterium]